MTKFGELIDEQKPILLNFFAEWSEDCENIHDQLKDVSAAVGDRAKLIKIDAEKNAQLVEALKVKKLPTYMLYKAGEMVWRQSGKLEANDLIILLEDNS
ncbi:thioredoxin family protein [Psychroflexus sp. CAK57W]|uniref:thioredoxin family protein n=1 Tax=Psychroflexus curvus TaxID=2873595 RepID=UPI001CCA9745|nr:thioredoxin family protein [Psychroflexus curvus]MBZ9628982.1 thioredoxin family protein [Psychroflexus curvus]MBZ9787368.1 thioredoxin family protein [Psychroflexus curvus]